MSHHGLHLFGAHSRRRTRPLRHRPTRTPLLHHLLLVLLPLDHLLLVLVPLLRGHVLHHHLVRHRLTSLSSSLDRSSSHPLRLGRRARTCGTRAVSPGRHPRHGNPLRRLLRRLFLPGRAVDSAEEEVVQGQVLRAEQPRDLLGELILRRLLV